MMMPLLRQTIFNRCFKRVITQGLHLPFLIGILLCMLISTLSPPAAKSSTETSTFTFYAVYDRIVDFQSLNFKEIYNALFSRDGKRVVLYGLSKKTAKLALITMTSEGNDVQERPLPEALNGIRDATLNKDGSVVYLLHAWSNALYKMENGRVFKIFDAAEYKQVTKIDQIQTTADGKWIYFREPRHSIWRISGKGGSPKRILQEKEVKRDGGISANIGLFRISDDGETMAFTMDGFWDQRGVFHAKHEVFVRHQRAFKQLTNDSRNIFKERLSLSGNGDVIAYTAAQPQHKMWAIHANGNHHRELETIVHVGPIDLNHDGTRLFYYDQAHGGRMVHTDGSGGIDLFPRYNVRAIALHAPWSLAVTSRGDQIGFRFNDGVYVGRIGRANAVADAPIIHKIELNPALVSEELARQGTTVQATISDPQGVTDIIRTETNGLLSGRTNKSDEKVPVFFQYPVNDVGAPPDQKKGDGIFSTTGRPGRKPQALGETQLRVSAMDKSLTVVVADAPLTGGSLSTPSSGKFAAIILETNTNRPGSDFRNFNLSDANPELCQLACMEDARCVAFTYVKPNVQSASARCWLKDKIPNPVPDNCCISGVKSKQQKETRTAGPGTGAEAPIGIPILSSEQKEILRRYGTPDTFEISIEANVANPDRVTVYESWRYFNYYSSFEFSDGKLMECLRLEAVPAWTASARQYSPAELRPGLDINQAKKRIGNQNLVSMKLPERFGNELNLYTADQIMLGFSEDILIYIATFALSAGEVGP
jgi:hypothetical protein